MEWQFTEREILAGSKVKQKIFAFLADASGAARVTCGKIMLEH